MAQLTQQDIQALQDAAEQATIDKERTPKQRAVIAYFNPMGCLSSGPSPISERQYDELIASRIKQINSRERAMAMLGISPEMVQEAQPMLLGGYDFVGSKYVRYGNDAKWRATTFEITWVFCGSEQLYVFSSGFETCSDRQWDVAREYYYKDITNVTHTVERVEKYRWQRNKFLEILVRSLTFGLIGYNKVFIEPVDYSAFGITDKGGDSFSCTIMKNEAIERSIQGLKTKIREKKFA